jgi:phosphoglycolate phosphatase-like HAD superfamily hydrolase
MKKIIFLDGDGTLWYPKETKRTVKPHWVYENENTKNNYLKHLELAPKIFETLEKMFSLGIYLVVVSANPNSEEQAVKEITERLEYFGIKKFFTSIRASKGDDKNGKGKIVLDELVKNGFKKYFNLRNLPDEKKMLQLAKPYDGQYTELALFLWDFKDNH